MAVLQSKIDGLAGCVEMNVRVFSIMMVDLFDTRSIDHYLEEMHFAPEEVQFRVFIVRSI